MTRASGIGSMPGTRSREAIVAVRDLLLDGEGIGLPYLPETPSRGPGADIIGRAAGLLVDLPVDLDLSNWRLVDRPGRDAERTAGLWREDLDELAAAYEGFEGGFKVQVAGPWTLAASLLLFRGERVISDPGAVRDLVDSLSEGVRDHVADVRRLVPGAQVVLQLDEPSLPAVLAGRVPTESGFGTHRPVETEVARGLLHDVMEAAGVPALVHCCAPDAPLELIRSAGAVGVALDLSLVTDLDPLGEAIDAGLGLLAGAAPTLPPPSGRAPTSAEVADRIRRVWDQLGFPRRRLAEQVVVTPACGLAGATPAYARAVLTACRDAGRRLAED